MYTHPNGITLRKLEITDLDKLQELKNESWEFTHNMTICNQKDQQIWFNNLDSHVHHPNTLFLIAMLGDRPIGVFKAINNWISRSSAVGWDLFKEWRGKGKGKDLVEAGCDFCLNCLNLRRLEAEVLANNERSQKCAEAYGFKKEGLKRESIFINGTYIDSIIYGVIYD